MEAKAVSIHTPTQGVTEFFSLFTQRQKVSIHTPTQGVTGCLVIIDSIKEVSIHTPTQGVTVYKRTTHTLW